MKSSTTTSYTIEQLNYYTVHSAEAQKYFKEVSADLSSKFGNKFNPKNTPYETLATDYKFLVCKRNGEISGHMICYIFESPLDVEVKILYQISFYVKPDSGRTAYHLFQKFIDIGKKEANHIITQLTSQTNIKSSTLEKLGFEELETLYRMEIK